MPINWNALAGGATPETTLAPREIFSLLPAKAVRYQYLRDVQGDVLTSWFDRRTERDLVLKLNTGSGKTVAGLLILRSSLNEGVSPAVYVSPTSYLADQVRLEAADLGLEVTDDPHSARFQNGKAILVIHVQRLINGMSIFGVSDEGIKIPIGSIVIDDAHSCLAISEEQFSIALPASHGAYKKLFSLFQGDLEKQSATTTADILEGDPSKSLLVPYWAWQDKQQQVHAILHPARAESQMKFAWPLLSETLSLCRCVFSGNGLEITPRCLPIDTLPAFVAAQRRIFLTAAFADDGVLITDFDATPDCVTRPITPPSAGDIGDRMILVPQELNPAISENDIKSFLAEQSHRHNVVVLVPSDHRASFWTDIADRTLNAGNLTAGVEELKNGHVGLVVLANKYDGIDLPDAACRILVIDGLPDVRKKIEKLEQAVLYSSDYAISRSMQRIEQGMGRGIRSNEDYCVVILMGRSLTSTLYTSRAIEKFTTATRAQFKLSEQLSEQLRGQEMDSIAETIGYCLNRDRNWVTKSRAATVQTTYETAGAVNGIATKRRMAFNAALTKNYVGATTHIQEGVNDITDSRLKGWMLQQLAEYTHPINKVEAQLIQKRAIGLNKSLTKPVDGIQYVKLGNLQFDQALQCTTYLQANYPNPNDFVLSMNALLESVIFQPETSEAFERSMAAIAPLIGFEGQRPEKDVGIGPDLLWRLGGLSFLVIECKNGATTEKVNKHDCNQLAGSMNWFQSQYDASCTAVPVMIHPYSSFERAGTPPPGTRVMTIQKLPDFVGALNSFMIGAIAADGQYRSSQDIATLLESLSLTAQRIVAHYTVPFRPGR